MTNEDAALVRAWLDDDTAPCPTSVRLAEFAYRYCDRDPIAWLAAIAVGRHMCREGSHEASADLLAENERLRLHERIYKLGLLALEMRGIHIFIQPGDG